MPKVKTPPPPGTVLVSEYARLRNLPKSTVDTQIGTGRLASVVYRGTRFVPIDAEPRPYKYSIR